MHKSLEQKKQVGTDSQFDHKNQVLSRGFWDPAVIPLMQKFGSKWIGAVPPKGTRGFSAIDFAFRVGG
jgi:hypothetical protein